MEASSLNKEEHFELCNLLNHTRLQDNPNYANWTPEIGRFDCFNMIKEMLTDCNSIQITGIGGEGQNIEKRRAPSGRLMKLLKDSVMYQYHVAKQSGTTTMFKFDPATQT